MQTSVKDFEKFKTYFKSWAKALGIEYWEVQFRHVEAKDCEESYACLHLNMADYVAIVKLSKEWDDRVVNNYSLKKCAKHEAIHMLIAKLSCCARSKYITRREIESSEEELVKQLVILIEDTKFKEV